MPIPPEGGGRQPPLIVSHFVIFDEVATRGRRYRSRAAETRPSGAAVAPDS